MKIISTKDYQSMCRVGANILSAQIILNPKSVLGLATGSTPLGVYNQLVDWYKKGDLDFSQIKSVNLDEYCGLSKNNKQSYYCYMYENFFRHINIDSNSIFIPNGMEKNVDSECQRYDSIIRKLGGVDYQLLGVGHNGHIGFNEPHTSFEKETHCVKLADKTIEANSRFFNSIKEVPTHAYTMGIKSIMKAKKILLLVSGESKAKILYEVLLGPIVPTVPASILQLHNDLTIVADKPALTVISEKFSGCKNAPSDA